MYFEFPASLEREIEQYAATEHISPSEAAVKLIEAALRTKKPKPVKHEITEADLETLRVNIPMFAFLENLPDSVVEAMEATSKEIRAERFIPRG